MAKPDPNNAGQFASWGAQTQGIHGSFACLALAMPLRSRTSSSSSSSSSSSYFFYNWVV
jgi:hypothetical protein